MAAKGPSKKRVGVNEAASAGKRAKTIADVPTPIKGSSLSSKMPRTTRQTGSKPSRETLVPPPQTIQSTTERTKDHQDDTKRPSAIIYIGHIPQGFFEQQMRSFFSQFGKVRKLKLFRSQRTGGSKGYGFLEFEDPSVAQVVAESMHGYLIQERQLVCHVVPIEKYHDGMFKRHVVRKDGSLEAADESPIKANSKSQLDALTKKQGRLTDMGIDFTILK
jgi:nucleolar protein 15